MSELVVEKSEKLPWHVESVQLTQDNAFDIAKWMGVEEFEVAYDGLAQVVSAEFNTTGWNVRLKLHDYVVKDATPVEDDYGVPVPPSYSGWPKDMFEAEFRKGWS